MNEQVGILVADGMVLRTTDGATNWTQVATYSGTVRDLDFSADGAHGAIVGVAGLLMMSHDSGISWTTVPWDTLQDLNSVGIRDGDVAIVDVINFPLVYATEDGGAQWMVRADISSFNDMQFLDGSHGFKCGSYDVFSTQDGGVTWIETDAPVMGGMSHIDFINAQEGWAAGLFGGISYTNDGGADWTLQHDDNETFHISSLDMHPSGLGLAATGLGFGAVRPVFFTTDHGDTWTAVIIGTEKPMAVSVPSAELAFLAEHEGDFWQYGHPVSVQGITRTARLQITPNPTQGVVWIHELPGDCSSVEVFDPLGQRLLEVLPCRGSVSLDLTPLPKGIFILRIAGATGLLACERVVKE